MSLKSFLCQAVPGLTLALLSSGAIVSAAVPSQTTFTGSITLASSQFDNYFVYNANGGAVAGVKGIGVTNPLTGQQNFVPSGTFPVSESISDYITTGYATAIGLYSPTGVSIAVNQNVYNTALGNETWDQVFAGTPESAIVTALLNDDQATLQTFLDQYSSNFISFSSNTSGAIPGGILHFSNAAAGGSLTFTSITAVGTPPPVSTATPEPATNVLLGAGLSIVVLASRKFKKA